MYLKNLDFSSSEAITKQLTDFIGGREVCIFENDYSIHDAIGNFYGWCVENKQLVNIKDELIDYLSTLDGYRIKVIEAYIHEPIFYRIPDNCAHIKMITLDSYQDTVKDWEIEELKCL